MADLSAMESWTAGGNSLRRAAFLGMAAVGACLLLRENGRRLRWDDPLFLLLAAYVLWCAASVQWSIDPGTTVRRLMVLGCCVIAALGLSRHLAPRDTVTVAIGVLLGYLVLGVAAEAALGTFRPWSGEYRFAGTVHPNTQGAYLALLALAAIAKLRTEPHHRGFYGCVLVLAMAFIVLTRSRTACAALLAGIAVMGSLSISPRAFLATLIGGVWLVSVIATMAAAFGWEIVDQLSGAAMMGRGEQAESLTGRLPLWSDLSWHIRDAFWTGHGFMTFWTPDHILEISSLQEWAISEAHSSYIESLLDLGLIGLVLWVSAALLGLRRAARLFPETKDPGFLFCVGAIVFGLLRGFTESGMNAPSLTSMILGVILLHTAHVTRTEPRVAAAWRRPAVASNQHSVT